jgi:hypothetical protein
VAETTGVLTNGNGKNPGFRLKLEALDVPKAISPNEP